MVFGPPKIGQMDNGTEFKGACKLLLDAYGVKIINGRPRTPRTQGLVEQANGITKQKIRAWKRQNGTAKWRQGLPIIANQMNRTWHGAIKKTPYEVVFGMEMRRNEIVPLGLRADMEIEDEGVNDNEDNEYGLERDFKEEQQLPDL